MQSVDSILQTASLSHQAGRFAEAELGYQKVLGIQPENEIALYLLGVVSIQLGKYSQAIKFLEEAIGLNGNEPSYYQNLSVAFASSAQLDRAVANCQKAIALAPHVAEFHLYFGNLLLQCNRTDDAITTFSDSIKYDPKNADAFRSLGRALLYCKGRFNESLSMFEQAILLDPNLAEAYNELGFVLHRLNRTEESIKAFIHAIDLKPNYANAYLNLSTAYRVLGMLDQAESACQQAIRLEPENADSHVKLGILLTDIGNQDEALVCFKIAMELRPDCPNTHSRFLFSLQYRPGITAAELLVAHKAFDRKHGEQHRQAWTSRLQGREASRPLRIGFVSDGLGRHPVGYFLSAFVSKIDPGNLKLTFYSDRPKKDEINNGLRAVANLWRDTADLNHKALVNTIREDNVDILFDLDGHVGKRLMVFAQRPCPIQITWMGYVGTTGLASMDYLLADRWEVPPEADSSYSEQVIRMPDGYVCFAAPTRCPDVVALPSIQNGFITFGCFNQPAKVNSKVIEVWARILCRVSNSQMRLQYKGYSESRICERIRETFKAFGVDPSRLQINGNKSHLELLTAYQSVDIGLDTFPYSGGMTTCESLWMGVPVVTVPKDTYASRHSLSHLSNVGLLSTIASNEEDYVSRAVSLASDLDALAETRRTLRSQMLASPLCDGTRFAKNWSLLLQRVWQSTREV